MKKLLTILCLFCFIAPCYCADGYREDCDFTYYDDNGTQAYAQKLKKEYYARVDKGELKCGTDNYVEYYEYPLFKYIEEHPIKYNE